MATARNAYSLGGVLLLLLLRYQHKLALGVLQGTQTQQAREQQASKHLLSAWAKQPCVSPPAWHANATWAPPVRLLLTPD